VHRKSSSFHLQSLRVRDNLIDELRALVVGTVVDVAALINHCSTSSDCRAPTWQGGYHRTYGGGLHNDSSRGWARRRRNHRRRSNPDRGTCCKRAPIPAVIVIVAAVITTAVHIHVHISVHVDVLIYIHVAVDVGIVVVISVYI